MKQSRKNCLLLIFVLLLALTLLATVAFAETDAPEEPPVSEPTAAAFATDDAAAAAGNVARIGEEGEATVAYFASVKDAIAAAETGDTVVVFGSEVVTAPINIGKTVTLAGSGSITGSGSSAISVTGGSLTLAGTLQISADAGEFVVLSTTPETLTIDGAKIISATSGIGAVKLSTSCTVELKSGTIDVQSSGLRLFVPCTVNISGGTWHTAKNPVIHQSYSSSNGAPSTVVITGGDLLSTGHNCIHFTGAPAAAHTLEISGETKVVSNAYAAIAVQGSSMADITVKGGTITGNSTSANRGAIYGAGSASAAAQLNVTIEGGTFNGKYGFAMSYAKLSVNIADGTFAPERAPFFFDETGPCPQFTAVISGGAFTPAGGYGVFDGSANSANLTVTDGTFGSTAGKNALYFAPTTMLSVAISGGTFTAGATYDAFLIEGSANTVVTISGGAFTGGSGANALRGNADSFLTLTVSGGVFEAGNRGDALLIEGTGAASATIWGGTFAGKANGLRITAPGSKLSLHGGTVTSDGTTVNLTETPVAAVVGLDASVSVPAGITPEPIVLTTTSTVGLLIGQMLGQPAMTLLDTGEQQLFSIGHTNYYDTESHATASAPVYIGRVDKAGTPYVLAFEDLTDAIAAAEEGATIVIRADFLISEPIAITKDLTLIGEGKPTIQSNFEGAALFSVSGTVRVSFLGSITYTALREVLFIGAGNPTVIVGDTVTMKVEGDGSRAQYVIHLEDPAGRPTLHLLGEVALSNEYENSNAYWSVIYSNCAAVRIYAEGTSSSRPVKFNGNGTSYTCNGIRVAGVNATLSLVNCRFSYADTALALTGAGTISLVLDTVQATLVNQGVAVTSHARAFRMVMQGTSVTAAESYVVFVNAADVSLEFADCKLTNAATAQVLPIVCVTDADAAALQFSGTTTKMTISNSTAANAVEVHAATADVKVLGGRITAANAVAFYLDACATAAIEAGTIAANTAATAFPIYLGRPGSSVCLGNSETKTKPTITTNANGRILQTGEPNMDVTLAIAAGVTVSNVSGFFACEDGKNYYKSAALASAVSFEAQIGSVKYPYLSDAIAAAEDGATIVILKNISYASNAASVELHDRTLTFVGSAQIEGKSTRSPIFQLTGTSNITFGGELKLLATYGALLVDDNATLTLTDQVTVTVATGTKGAYAVALGKTGSYPTFNMTGNATLLYQASTANTAAIYVNDAATATVNLASGKVQTTNDKPDALFFGSTAAQLSVGAATVTAAGNAVAFSGSGKIAVSVTEGAAISGANVFMHATQSAASAAVIRVRGAELTAAGGAVFAVNALQIELQVTNSTLTASGAILGGIGNKNLTANFTASTLAAGTNLLNATAVRQVAEANVTLQDCTATSTNAAFATAHDNCYITLSGTTVLNAPTLLTQQKAALAAVTLNGATLRTTGTAIALNDTARASVTLNNAVVEAPVGITAACPVTLTAANAVIRATDAGVTLNGRATVTLDGTSVDAGAAAITAKGNGSLIRLANGNFTSKTSTVLEMTGENVTCSLTNNYFLTGATTGAVIRIGASGDVTVAGKFACAGGSTVLDSPDEAVAIAYAPGQNVYTANVIVAQSGASVSMTGEDHTIRFAVIYTEADLAAYCADADDGAATVHIAVLPTAAWDTLTVRTPDAIAAAAAGYTAQPGERVNDDGSVMKFVRLIGLSEEDITREFSVIVWVSYLKNGAENNEFCLYTPALHSRSIAAVAANTLADESIILTAAQRAVLEAYAAKLPQ